MKFILIPGVCAEHALGSKCRRENHAAGVAAVEEEAVVSVVADAAVTVTAIVDVTETSAAAGEAARKTDDTTGVPGL